MASTFKQTWEAIEQQGPFIPEKLDEFVPDGFRIMNTIRNRSRITGQLMPSKSGLGHTFVNAVYIGHWVQRRAIIKWYNHEPIIDEDLFMRVFNSLSDLTLRGERNEKYFAQRTFVRHDYERPERDSAISEVMWSRTNPMNKTSPTSAQAGVIVVNSTDTS